MLCWAWWWDVSAQVFWARVADAVFRPRKAQTPSVVADGDHCFSSQELTRLCALRERYQATNQYSEMDLDERRLGFARWLVEHGRIGEDIAAG
jgi:hypothetical protein